MINMDVPVETTVVSPVDSEMNPLACLVCGSTFKHLAKLKSHLILHEAEKTYKCEFCGKLFSKSSNLYSHIRTHTGEKPYQCTVCKKFFPRMNNLRAHIVKIHQICRDNADRYILIDGQPVDQEEKETRNFELEGDTDSNGQIENTDNEDRVMLNGSTVTETEFYTIHLDTVTFIDNASGAVESSSKKMSYKCKTCEKRMNHKSNMEDHVRSHSGLKLFRCKLCDKGLSRKQNLIHHLRHIHFVENDKVQEMIIKNDETMLNRDDLQENITGAKAVSRTNSKLKLFDDLGKTDIAELSTLVNTKPTATDLDDQDLNNQISELVESNQSEANAGMDAEYSDADTEDLDFNGTIAEITNKLNDAADDFESVDPLTSNGINTVDVSHSDSNNSQNEEELPYIVHNRNDFKLKMYECRTCGFKCKRRYYMAVEHVMTHTNYKPFLCVVCCKSFSRRTTLRGHLQKEHKFSGSELEELMTTTGNKVPATLPSKTNTASHTDMYVNGFDDFASTSDNQHSYDSFTDSGQVTDALNAGNIPDKLQDKSNENCDIESEDLDVVMDSIEKLRNEIKFLQDAKDEGTEILLGDAKPKLLEQTPEASEDNCIDNNMGEEFQDCTDKEMRMSADSSDIASIDHNGFILENSNNSSVMEMEESIEALNESLSQTGSKTRAKKTKLKPDFEEKVKCLMDVQNLSCLLCKKKCSNKSNLKQHVRLVHINMKEFTCVICGKKYSTRFNLKVHWRQHTVSSQEDLKQFDCKKCGKLFTTKSYLKVHMTNQHGTDTETIGELSQLENGLETEVDESQMDQDSNTIQNIEKIENLGPDSENGEETENQKYTADRECPTLQGKENQGLESYKDLGVNAGQENSQDTLHLDKNNDSQESCALPGMESEFLESL